jgi:TolA-binding protein
MTRTRFVIAASLAALLLVPQRASAQNRVDQQVFLDLRAMQEQTQQLKLTVNALLEQLRTVNTRLDAEAAARSKSFADQQTLINSVNSALSTLQENVRDNKVQVQKLTQELDAIKIGISNLTTMVIQALAQVPASGTDAFAPGGAAPATPASSSGGVPPSAKDYYQPAFSDYIAGSYEMAIKGFEEVIKRFPDSPQAADAQFFIGGSYAYLRKYSEAIVAYDALVSDSKFRGNEHTAEALYRQGDCYEQLNQRAKAIDRYQLVRKDFPGTTAEVLATQALKRLGVLK